VIARSAREDRAWKPLPSSLTRRRKACLLVRSSRTAARDPGRVESAYFVVARRGKNASARSSSARRRAISRRSQLVSRSAPQMIINFRVTASKQTMITPSRPTTCTVVRLRRGAYANTTPTKAPTTTPPININQPKLRKPIRTL
jgi:hypothetical protein